MKQAILKEMIKKELKKLKTNTQEISINLLKIKNKFIKATLLIIAIGIWAMVYQSQQLIDNIDKIQKVHIEGGKLDRIPSPPPWAQRQ